MRPNRVHAALQIFSELACPASECQLFCKDMWEARHRRIFMNPRVRFAYNGESELLQRVPMRLWNALLLSWSHHTAARHHSLRAPSIQSSLGTVVPWAAEHGFDDLSYDAIPLRLACGLSEDVQYGV